MPKSSQAVQIDGPVHCLAPESYLVLSFAQGYGELAGCSRWRSFESTPPVPGLTDRRTALWTAALSALHLQTPLSESSFGSPRMGLADGRRGVARSGCSSVICKKSLMRLMICCTQLRFTLLPLSSVPMRVLIRFFLASFAPRGSAACHARLSVSLHSSCRPAII